MHARCVFIGMLPDMILTSEKNNVNCAVFVTELKKETKLRNIPTGIMFFVKFVRVGKREPVRRLKNRKIITMKTLKTESNRPFTTI